MKFKPLKPEMYVTDLAISLSFYTQLLNFKIEYQRKNPPFAYLSYFESQIMLQQLTADEGEWLTGKLEHPYGRGINFQIDTPDVDKVAAILKTNKYSLQKDVWDSWYEVNNSLHGCRQILVKDPDGYLLRFSQDIGIKKTI